MKKVMDNFNWRTEKRKTYNKKCDNDIKEIIVKDKIEKQLIKKFFSIRECNWSKPFT